MSDRRLADGAVAYLAACILLGGASAAGAAANGLLQLAGLGIILLLVWRWTGPLPAEAKGPLWLGGLFVVAGLLSLVPLPPPLWTALPLRDFVAAGYRLMGMELPAIPLSLTPPRTVAALLSLIPPAAMFLLVLRLPGEARRRLALALILLAGASILLGALQLMGGNRSPLRFYAHTNADSAVGFFANINHQATLLLCALPFTAALAAQSAKGRRSTRSAGLIVSLSLGLFLTAGVAMTGSSAAYGLLIPVGFAAVLLYRRAVVGRLGAAWGSALAVLLLGFVVLGLGGPLSTQALTQEISDDPASRRVLAATSLQAIAASFPAGTGLGSFATVYRLFENPDRVLTAYANHAHNDYLELTLELGAAGMVLLLGFVLWWARQSWRHWTTDSPGATLGRAGSIAIGVVLLHSLVDYPARAAAIAVVVAVASGLMLPPALERQPRPAGERSRPALRQLEVA